MSVVIIKASNGRWWITPTQAAFRQGWRSGYIVAESQASALALYFSRGVNVDVLAPAGEKTLPKP